MNQITLDILLKFPELSIGYWADKKCPVCGSGLLTNMIGEEWCSYNHCKYDWDDDLFE